MNIWMIQKILRISTGIREKVITLQDRLPVPGSERTEYISYIGTGTCTYMKTLQGRLPVLGSERTEYISYIGTGTCTYILNDISIGTGTNFWTK
jgi:hypothetical protein